MAERAHSRGAAVAIAEPLPAAPQGVMHYAPGPVTYGSFKKNGVFWLAVYEAENDGTGWLVMKATIRPLVVMEGDHVHPRMRVLEHRGPQLLVELKRGGQWVPTLIDTDSIVFLEEAPGITPKEPAIP